MSEWTRERINQVVRQYIKETLANNEMCRQMPRISSGATQTLEGKTLLEASDILFFKRICDVYNEEYATAMEFYGDEKMALAPEQHRIEIPEGCHCAH